MPSPTLVKRGRGPWLAARLHGSMQRTSNICLHLYLAGSVTNSWSLLPTPSFSPSSPTYARFLTQHTCHTACLTASPGAFQMARILASMPVTTDNSQTHKGKSALKLPDFQLPVALLCSSVLFAFPLSLFKKAFFPKRSPILPSDFHSEKEIKTIFIDTLQL